MNFKRSTFKQNKDYYLSYYYSLQGGFDDYIEDMLMEGTHIDVFLDDKQIGVFALNKEDKLMCIVLEGTHSHLYEDVFDQALLYGHTQGILTTTNDTLMISSIIRRNIKIHKQAYNFVVKKVPAKVDFLLNYRTATVEDKDTLQELFGDFLDDYETYAKDKRIYLGLKDQEIVSLGHIKHHTLTKDTVSIGMIVREDMRENGYAKDTISFLIEEGIKRNCTVQAGCWYYNHASKKTLTSTGLEVISLIIRADEL